LLLLELDEAAEIGELGVMEVGLAEPALDAGGHGARFLGGTVGGGECLGVSGECLEGLAADGVAGLDDDDRRLGPGSDRLRQCAEKVRFAVRAGGLGRRAHDDEVCLLGFAEDRVADVGRLADDPLAAALQVLAEELGEGVLRLGPDRQGDPRRDEVKDADEGVVAGGDRIRITDGQLGVRPAADRDDDPPDLLRAALLDDGYVGRRIADDLVDRRREDGRVAVPAAERLAAPAEDDEIGLLLGRRLDDPLGGVATDPDDRVDRRSLRREVEDLLEEAPGVAGAGRPFRQSHPLRHLDDPEGGQLTGPRIEQVRSELHQLLGRRRVGDGDQDAGGQRRADGHAGAPAPTAASQRSTR
jgi:hypothetical protein